jgi:hypothetical protein
MKQFQSLFVMSPDVFTIVRLRSLVEYTKNLRMVFEQWVRHAALTLDSGMWIGRTSTNLPMTFWLQMHQCAKRGYSTYKEKGRQNSKADGRVGNACNVGLFPDRFAYKERGERRIALKMFVLLYIMRAKMVEINQIQNIRSAKQDDIYGASNIVLPCPGS